MAAKAKERYQEEMASYKAKQEEEKKDEKDDDDDDDDGVDDSGDDDSDDSDWSQFLVLVDNKKHYEYKLNKLGEWDL